MQKSVKAIDNRMSGGSLLKPTYESVDLAKFIGSFLVVANHTAIFRSVSETANHYFINLFCRLAVYFYFIASAYFFFQGLKMENGKIIRGAGNLQKLKKYLIRVGLLYCLWSLVYLIQDVFFWSSAGCLTFANIKGYALSFFINSSHFHLWFVISLIYAIPIMYAILRFFGKRVLFVLSGVLYIIQLLNGSYSFLNISFLRWMTKLGDIWPRMNTVLFAVVPICSLALLCDKIKLKKGLLWALAVSFFLLFSFEGMILYFCVSKNTSPCLIFTLPAVLFIFIAVKISPVRLKRSFEIRKLSTIIYCMHPLVITLFSICFESNKMNSIVYFVTISVITLVVGMLILLLYKKTKYARFLKWFM